MKGARAIPAAAALTIALATCSSAPAPERSSHPDSAQDGGRHAGGGSSGAGDASAGAAGARPADVAEDELTALRRRLGCQREGPAQPGSTNLACGLLALFSRGTAPTWREGVLPGVAVEPGADGRDTAQPALLAVRTTDAVTQVAWGRIPPHDPREAAELAGMAADVLAGRAPTLLPTPWPGLAWAPPRPTEGASAQLATGPRVLARTADDATIVLVLDSDGPWLALHRAP